MPQREFMLKALESNDELNPTGVMKYWEQRKALEVKPQKLPTQETYYDKRDYLSLLLTDTATRGGPVATTRSSDCLAAGTGTPPPRAAGRATHGPRISRKLRTECLIDQ